MSLFNRPSEPLGQIGEKVPEGFVRADELMGFALPARWGEGFLEKAIETLPVGIPRSEKLRGAIDNGRAIGVAQSIREALTSGALLGWEVRRRSKKEWYPPERIPSSDWSAVDVSSIVYVLLTGTGDPTEQSMRGWRDQPVIAFKVDDAESWICTLTAATSLPPVDTLPIHELPYDRVSVSAALSWRVGQQASNWYDVSIANASVRETAEDIAASWDQAGTKHELDAQCQYLSDRLARNLQRNRAKNELLRLLASGLLRAWGVKRPGHGELELIDLSEFRVSRKILDIEDQLIPGDPTDSTELSIALRQGTWKHVRFLTGDLLAALRGVEAPTHPQVAPTAQPSDNKLLAKPPKLQKARDWARQAASTWEPGGRKLGREETIRLLMSEFDLPRQLARDVWNDLPQKMRRPRGNPGKS